MTICPRCQNLFNPSKTQIYCSEYCRMKAQKLRNRRRHAHPRPPPTLKPAPKPRWRRPRLWYFGPTLAERLEFWSIPEPNSGCRLWLGKLSKKGGYAIIKIHNKPVRVNRLAYELAKGPLPPGALACHHCDTPACIEPNHIYAGTYKSNAEDMVRRGRRRGGRAKKPKPLPKFAGEGI
jgi:hypothetical protein